MRLGKVLLKGQVGLVEFEEARRGDPLVPAAKRNDKASESETGWTRASMVGGVFSGDARLLPAFVVHKVMRTDGV